MTQHVHPGRVGQPRDALCATDRLDVEDRAMPEAAEYGRMLWDGKGTVNNVVNLSRDHKPIVVYVAPTQQFRTITTFEDLGDLLAQGDSHSVDLIVRELHLKVVQQRAAGWQSWLAGPALGWWPRNRERALSEPTRAALMRPIVL
jgi:hypothetical protein